MSNITLIIDGKKIRISDELNIWQAAKSRNINIPTLCYLEGSTHTTSCMVCLVWDKKQNKLIPSCSVKVKEGMNIETDNEKVRDMRKSSLELLLAEHLGDCLAPCQKICPAHPHIPQMIRDIRSGHKDEAYKTIKKELILPAVLSYICPAPCESGCRRSQYDSGISICMLHRFTALKDRKIFQFYIPSPKPATGKKVSVVGAGPAGLSGAFTLFLEGHSVTIFEQKNLPGGSLHSDKYRTEIPPSLLDKEIQTLLLPGMNLHFGPDSGRIEDLIAIKNDYDVVLLTPGKQETDSLKEWGFGTTKNGILVRSGTYETTIPGIFAAGSIIKEYSLTVRLLAQGKEAARSMIRFLNQENLFENQTQFNSRMGKLSIEEIDEYFFWATKDKRIEPERSGSFTLDEAKNEAHRCFSCDCKKNYSCELRKLASDNSAVQPRILLSKHKTFKINHGKEDVLFEPGKCIKCGICIQILIQHELKIPGLAFNNRGFEIVLKVPFNVSFKEALGIYVEECIKYCPTSALSIRNTWEKINE